MQRRLLDLLLRRTPITSAAIQHFTPSRFLLGVFAGFVLAIAALLPRPAVGAVTFVDTANTGLPAPGALTNFTSFGTAAITGSITVFSGIPEGIYASSATPSQILWMSAFANTKTFGPSPGLPFMSSFGPPSADGSLLGFSALDNNGGSNLFIQRFDPATGALTWQTFAAWSGSPAPGASTFASIGDPSLSGAIAAFRSSTSAVDGVFAVATDPATGLILWSSRFAAVGDPAPGGTTFTQFGDPSLSGNTLAFSANTADGATGLYEVTFDATTGATSVVTRLVRIGDPAPGGGTFSALGDPLIDENGKLFFFASTSTGRSGIFSAFWNGSATDLQTAVDTNTPIPGGGSTFGSFGSFSVGDGAIAFAAAALSATQQGIFYLASDATLSSIVDEGDTLFGKTVLDLQFGNDALGEKSLDFIALFSDSSSSVVRADFEGAAVPEPATLALLGLGLSGLALTRRRRKS